MRTMILSGLVCASMVLAVPQSAFAHGGQYRGPGDVVPPNPGGGGGRSSTPGPGGPTTPGPGGPATPGPSGPTTPGPSGPTTAGPAPAAGRGPTTPGMDVGPDLTRWQFWWEFNKDPFIRLKEAVHATEAVTHSDDVFFGASKRVDAKDTMKPSKNDILNTILPALKRAIDSTDQRDINSSCMVAMAKIGMDTESIKILPIFKERLNTNDQEIRETAALAMGISQMQEAEPLLRELVLDTPAARTMLGNRGDVDDRTRSFAAYGLGLVGYATSNVDLKRSIFEALKSVLEDKRVSSRNVKVAIINAIRVLRPQAGVAGNADNGDKASELQKAAIDVLWAYYNKDLGVGEQLMQAHVPPAIATLLGRGGDTDGKYKDAFLKELQTRDSKKQDVIPQSCALALGALAQPVEVVKGDGKYSEALLEYYQNGKDKQTTYFSLIALAQIGGKKNRDELMKVFTRARTLPKSWAGLALGVLAFKAMEANRSAGIDVEIGRLLVDGLREEKNDNVQGAIAVGLGLAKYLDAADDVRAMLEKYKKDDERAGYFCIGLALMNDTRSKDLIQEIVKTSVRRPDLLKQAAIALGKMGDKNVTETLQQMLTDDPNPNVAKLSAVASALGFIGDRRTVQPLVSMLFNEQVTDLARAFAAVALGGTADKEDLPWNSKIAVDLNYRAAVETLTNQLSGVLDIL